MAFVITLVRSSWSGFNRCCRQRMRAQGGLVSITKDIVILTKKALQYRSRVTLVHYVEGSS